MRRRVRGKRPHVHDAAARAGDDPRDREAGADVRGSRGLPAAPAALVHRRADEPVHLALDRRDGGRRAAGAPRRAARRRSHARARRRRRTRGAALHPLQRVPQRLSGLLAHRRPRVRVGVPGPDRRDPDPAAPRHRERAEPAVRLEPLRCVLRGLPGEDRHSAGVAAPAEQGGRGGPRPPRTRRYGGRGEYLRRPATLRARGAAGADRAASVRPPRSDSAAPSPARRPGRGHAT